VHQEPEHEDYDDDDYNYYPNNYNDFGYPKNFSLDEQAWEKWLKDTIKHIVEEDYNVWVFGNKVTDPTQKFNMSQNSYKDKYFMYLGSNDKQEHVWKSKYFVVDMIDQEYQKHIKSNAKHFLRQPSYYKGLFENLN